MSPHKREHCILLNYATCTRWKHRSYIKIFASPLKKKKNRSRWDEWISLTVSREIFNAYVSICTLFIVNSFVQNSSSHETLGLIAWRTVLR